MKIISFVLPCLLVLLVVQPLLSQKHPNRRRLVWQSGVGLLPAEVRDAHSSADSQGVSNNCKLPGGETIDEWAFGDGTIRLVKNNRRMLY